MTKLIIDTSNEHPFISLIKRDGRIKYTLLPSGPVLSKFLLPSLQNLLQEETLALEELDSIFIGKGPGSFTGTRVGVTTTQALSYSLKIPLYSFDSPLAYIPPIDGPFAFLGKKRTEFFPLISGVCENKVIKEGGFKEFISETDLAPLLENIPTIITDDPSFKEQFPSKKVLNSQFNLNALLPLLDKKHPYRGIIYNRPLNEGKNSVLEKEFAQYCPSR